jgi:hypothetical protein
MKMVKISESLHIELCREKVDQGNKYKLQAIAEKALRLGLQEMRKKKERQ